MADKLEVGMYARTEFGIARVEKIDPETCSIYVDKILPLIDDSRVAYEFIIGEPSFDIIDVIECGDLVNDMYIESNNGVELYTDQIDYTSSSLGHLEYETIYKTCIEKVITKEQLAAMTYEVKKDGR